MPVSTVSSWIVVFIDVSVLFYSFVLQQCLEMCREENLFHSVTECTKCTIHEEINHILGEFSEHL
jgi:hypothetical protein